jgi:hypothetical protein
MRTRLSLTLLLLLLATTARAASLALNIEPGPSAARQETELTPEEEREARALAVRFMKRLNAADDCGPLVDEFFVEDFPERFKQFLREIKVKDKDLQVFTLDVLMRADHNDLRRAYIALLNFYNLQDLLRDAAIDYVAAVHGITDWVELHKPAGEALRRQITEDALTPEFFAAAKNDAALAALVNLFVRDDDEGEENCEEKIEAGQVCTPERFRRLTAELEKCVGLMRAAVGRLRGGLSKLGTTAQAAGEWDRDKYLIYKFSTSTLESEVAGYPRGTRLVAARIFPFEMLMIRQGGRFRMLAVYPDFDGD